MPRKAFLARSRLSSEGAVRPPRPSPLAAGRAGTAKSLFRPLSRRQFLGATAGAGIVLGAETFLPKCADADAGGDVLPNPIPFAQKLLPPTPKYGPFHFMFPGPADQGNEPSLITDFNGFIGGVMFKGSGKDGAGHALTFSGDMRFMKGVYVGVDHKTHRGAFAFI
jgi:hypothetical protein